MDIVIWGCNSFSKCLYQLLQGTNLNVVAFVDGSTDSIFCGKPLYQPSEFKVKKEFLTIPVIIAVPHSMSNNVPNVNFESIRQFKIKMQELVDLYAIDNLLLHPAALVDILKLNFSNKVITFGFNGSGNAIFNHILLKIFQIFPGLSSTNPQVLFFKQISYEYTQIIHQLISDIAYSKGAHTIHVGPWKVGTTFFRCFFANEKILDVFSFLTRDHIIGDTYGYHQLLSQDYLSKLQSQGFNTFFVIRNPLDIILSYCKKKNAISHETNELSTPDFCKHALRVIAQLNAFYPLHFQMKLIRYEDLIRSPIQEIKNIMRQLNVSPFFFIFRQFKLTQGLRSFIRNLCFFPISLKKIAKRIWGDLGFKELPAVPKGHFWKGGGGKWEMYFKQEHLAFLKAAGIENILDKFEYNDVLDRFRTLTSFVPDSDVNQYLSNEVISSSDFSERINCSDEYSDTYIDLCDIYGEMNCSKIAGFNVRCDDPKLLDYIKDAFESKYVNKIVLAGVLPQFRHFLN